MRKVRWKAWLAIWLALDALGSVGFFLLHGLLSIIVGAVGHGGAFLWLVWGLYRLREYPLARRTQWIVVSGAAVGGLNYLFLYHGRVGSAIALAGVWIMTLGFIFGLWLIRRLLAPGWPITGIARTVIDEGVRMKVVLVFIVGLVLIVPILPFVLDPAERLEYRLQFFLTWAMTCIGVLLGILTIFLSCSTITSEINDRQIFLTMSKSVSRAEYLLGKWLGIALLNLLLVIVGGFGVFMMAKIVEGSQVQSVFDRLAVQNQVMVARAAVRPAPPPEQDLGRMFDARLQQLIRERPEDYEGELSPKDRRAIEMHVLVKWHTIGPRESQTFVFAGVNRAKRFAAKSADTEGGPNRGTIQLRLKPKHSKSAPDRMVRMALWVNGRPFPVAQNGQHMELKLASGNFHVLDLPLALVDEQGKMAVRVQNILLSDPDKTWPHSVTFAPDSDIELYYTVGTFEGNLARALLLIWIRLTFLAMLGLLTATFLGFHVAWLLALLVYFAASISGYLVEALSDYAGLVGTGMSFFDLITGLLGNLGTALSGGYVVESIRVVLRIIGEFFVHCVPYLGGYDPVPLISDGRLVPWSLVGRAALVIGLGWGGTSAVVAWWIFRKRELARVMV